VDFEAYLLSKKIDSAAFLKAEPDVWSAWKREFDQIHPKSFTAQKLYLINPIRRKYLLKQEPEKIAMKSQSPIPGMSPAVTSPNPVVPKPKPVMPKPVFKPKPKTD